MFGLALLVSGFSDRGIWIIDAQSQLTIQGSTNVNDFFCRVEYCAGTDTLQYQQDNDRGQMLFTRSRMTVPVRSFDCGAKPISKDFWKTLKADTYPQLEINFISLETPNFRDGKNIRGAVSIKLAGVTARYSICYQVNVYENGNVWLKGNHAVNFSDFELEAPEKLKGLIRVKEVLNVEFNLMLTKV